MCAPFKTNGSILIGALVLFGFAQWLPQALDFTWEILWTDALIFVLLAAAILLARYMAQRPHLREPWARVRRSRVAMASAVILGVYVVIGLLDSIHFRVAVENTPAGEAPQYRAEVESVLDRVLQPLRERSEKTYSAPFAAYAYTRETVEGADGRPQRMYPRLVHGAAHLTRPETERAGDVTRRAARGALAGVSIGLLVSGWVAYVQARRARRSFVEGWRGLWRGPADTPWPAILLTITALLVIAGTLVALAPWYHVLGTDKVGQDVLYQALKSIRTGLVIGTITTLIMLPFALVLGVMAGYFRGWIDDGIQYLYTTLNSIPGVLLIAAAVLMVEVYMSNRPQAFESIAARADLRLFWLCVILGITSWTGLCRLLRGEALKLRQLEYVQAAVAFGVSHAAILARHVLPNVMHIVLITVVLDFSGLVLAEAVLTYVGVGVDPSMYSWGNMINQARLELAREPVVWWSLLAAFVFMFGLVLPANLFSDAVRDAFDPRLRERS